MLTTWALLENPEYAADLSICFKSDPWGVAGTGNSRNVFAIRARARFSPFTWCLTPSGRVSHTASGLRRFATMRRAPRLLRRGSLPG